MSVETVNELYSNLDNNHDQMVSWGWTRRTDGGDINEGRHNAKWKFGCTSKCVDIGRFQSFYVKKATHSNNPKGIVMIDAQLKPNGQCPVGYTPNDGQYLNHSTDDYGCGYKRICTAKKPLTEATQYVNDIYMQRGGAGCPSGYINLGRIHDCNRGTNVWACAKINPINYLQDHYCLPSNGTALETSECRDIFKNKNKALFDARVKEYCKANPRERFASNGVCRFEAEAIHDTDYDEMIRQYCVNNPKDAFCNCTTSSLKARFIPSEDDPQIFDIMGGNPHCFLSMGCATGDSKAYRFAHQRNPTPCDITIQKCDIKISNVVGSEIKNVYCQQTVEKKAAEAKRLADIQAEEAAKKAETARLLQEAQAKANAEAARVAAAKAQSAAEEAARQAALAKAKAEQERILAEKKAKQFLPLPASIRKITDPWDVPDTVLTGGILLILLIILYLGGIFDDEDEEETSSEIQSLATYQQQYTDLNSPYVQY